jgi:hypothetical protein
MTRKMRFLGNSSRRLRGIPQELQAIAQIYFALEQPGREFPMLGCPNLVPDAGDSGWKNGLKLCFPNDSSRGTLPVSTVNAPSHSRRKMVGIAVQDYSIADPSPTKSG